MTRTTIVVATMLALAVTLPAVSAQAAGILTRTFVSSAGVDTNPCTIAAPCATFATAYNAVEANGIVAALDPGKYGPITITGPVTINGNGWAAITAPAAGNGITITAGSGNVILKGLEIDGAGAAYNGIEFNSGSSLTVTNCSLQNFIFGGSTTGNGILLQPTSDTISFVITNTSVSNNTLNGIVYQPPSGSVTAEGVIDHVVATNNGGDGILIDTSLGGGSTTVAISNGIASNNSAVGISIKNGSFPLAVSIDNTGMSGNATGIYAYGTANVILGRSVITANGFGIYNGTSPNTFFSYQDNRINGNNPDYSGSVPNSHALR